MENEDKRAPFKGELPPALKDAWLLIESLDIRIARLNLAEHLWPSGTGDQAQELESLQEKRLEVLLDWEKLLKLQPMPSQLFDGEKLIWRS